MGKGAVQRIEAIENAIDALRNLADDKLNEVLDRMQGDITIARHCPPMSGGGNPHC